MEYKYYILKNTHLVQDIEMVEEEEPRIGAYCSSATSNKFEIYKEEVGNAAQKHKTKRWKVSMLMQKPLVITGKVHIALCILKLKH